MHALPTLIRWWTHLAARPLRDHLVPRGMAWLLLLVQLDAMVDMPAASRVLRAQPAGVAAAAVAAMVALHGVSERHGVDQVVRHPRFAVLRRQPLGRWALGVPAVLVLGALCLPMALLGGLWSRSPAVAAVWTLGAVVPVGWAGARRWGRFLAGVGWAALLGASAQGAPWAAWPLVAVAALVAIPSSGEVALRWPMPPEPVPLRWAWRPRTPWAAWVQRDALVLWRTERSPLWTGLLAAPLVGAMVWAARVNGDYAGGALVTGTTLALAFVAPMGLSAAAAIARGLGPQFDPPSLPTPASLRVGSLAAVVSLTLVPSWAAAGVGGQHALGLVHHLQLACTVGALALVAAALVAWRPRRPDHGLYPYAIAVTVVGSLFAGSPLLGALATAALGALAWVVGARQLTLHREAR